MRRRRGCGRSMPFYFSLSDQLKSYWFGCKRGPNEAADLSRLFGPQQIFGAAPRFIFRRWWKFLVNYYYQANHKDRQTKLAFDGNRPEIPPHVSNKFWHFVKISKTLFFFYQTHNEQFRQFRSPDELSHKIPQSIFLSTACSIGWCSDIWRWHLAAWRGR